MLLVAGAEEFRLKQQIPRQEAREHCSAIYLIGEAMPRLRAALAGTRAIHECGDLETAVTTAAKRAYPGEVVLLAPACASYDQFRNFEERGDRFRELVAQLVDPAAPPA